MYGERSHQRWRFRSASQFALLGAGAVSRYEVIQLGAVIREVGTLIVGEAHLSARQQENLAGQAVGPGAVGAAGAAVLPVGDFDLLDRVAMSVS